MDYITSRVFVIGVGIFMTLAIVTGVILVLSQVNEVYNAVENTNTSIIAEYDNIYSQYGESTLNTVGLLNTLRKYEEESDIHVLATFNNSEEATAQSITDVEQKIQNGTIGYETLFNVSVKEESGQMYIVFKIK